MNKTSTYNELYNAIACLAKESTLSIYEVYGVISTLESVTRLALLGQVNQDRKGEVDDE